MNLVYSKMYLSVPDSVLRVINEDMNNNFDMHKRKRIYHEIRKDLLGETSIGVDDLKYFSEGNQEPAPVKRDNPYY